MDVEESDRKADPLTSRDPLSLESLLEEGGLPSTLTAHLTSVGATLNELQALRLGKGRSALLERLKILGVTPITDRQKVASVLARASRSGRIDTKLHAPSVDFVSQAANGKIAFLFLIYDCIHHEPLWETYFHGAASSEHYSIYVHAKSRAKPLSPFFEKAHLPAADVVETAYADISLVQAMRTLLRAALQDPANRKFVFVSGACVPVKPFSFAYASITGTDSCRFSAMVDLGNDDREQQRKLIAAGARHGLEQNHVAKASQWSILNHRVASACASASPGFVSAFAGIRAPDEWFFYTTARFTAAASGVEDLIAAPDLHRNHCGPTFVNWRDADGEPSRPLQYTRVCIDDLFAMVHGPSFFARKFAASCEQDLRPLEAMLSQAPGPYVKVAR